MVDSDHELGGRGGFVLLALPAFLPSAFFSFFTVNRVGGGRGNDVETEIKSVLLMVDCRYFN